jgi:hypothetical protein
MQDYSAGLFLLWNRITSLGITSIPESKVFIQSKKKNFMMQAYRRNEDIHWWNRNAGFALFKIFQQPTP